MGILRRNRHKEEKGEEKPQEGAPLDETDALESELAATESVGSDLAVDSAGDGLAGDHEEEEVSTNTPDEDFHRDDPLAPGYDLDDGAPMDELEPEEPPKPPTWKAKVGNPKEFFHTELIYRYDILEDEERSGLFGTYRIELGGEEEEVWSLELQEQLDVVNGKNEADTVLSMDRADFLRLINGKLNPQLAFLAKKIKVVGDIRKASALQSILVPESS